MLKKSKNTRILHCFIGILFVMEMTAELTLADYLSLGVSRAICSAHDEFVQSGKMAARGGLKTPTKALENVPSSCIWYKRDPKPGCKFSADSSNSDSGCSKFTSKSCEELGLDSKRNQKQGRNSGGRIVGGIVVDPPNKYPSFARLKEAFPNLTSADAAKKGLQETDESSDQPIDPYRCGSVIVSEGWVLTASHCIEDFDGVFEFIILAGRFNVSVPEEGEQAIKAVEAIYHPPVIDPATGNETVVDLVLLKMESPFQFNQNISAARFPTERYETGNFVIVGTGYTAITTKMQSEDPEETREGNSTRVDTDVPLELELPAITDEKCTEFSVGNGFSPITPHGICFYKGSGYGSCYGDSGGPAYKIVDNEDVTSQVLVGISWKGTSRECASETDTAVYTEIFPFLDWIQSNIKGE